MRFIWCQYLCLLNPQQDTSLHCEITDTGVAHHTLCLFMSKLSLLLTNLSSIYRKMTIAFVNESNYDYYLTVRTPSIWFPSFYSESRTIFLTSRMTQAETIRILFFKQLIAYTSTHCHRSSCAGDISENATAVAAKTRSSVSLHHSASAADSTRCAAHQDV